LPPLTTGVWVYLQKPLVLSSNGAGITDSGQDGERRMRANVLFLELSDVVFPASVFGDPSEP